MKFFLIFTATLLFAALQARLPTAWGLGGLRFEFLPALVAYGALSFRRPACALTLAAAAGLCQDALSAAPIGNSVAAYLVATMAIAALGRAFDRHKLWMQMLAGAVASATASCAALAVIGFSSAAPKLLAAATLSAAVTPLLFLGLDFCARRTSTA
ncbi:MAG: hypothetical protein N3B01_11055 [Verrucomicrobiae bacterium]|nr:hypothetical protein [Verrucomicrobiae bacterium]